MKSLLRINAIAIQIMIEICTFQPNHQHASPYDIVPIHVSTTPTPRQSSPACTCTPGRTYQGECQGGRIEPLPAVSAP